MERVSWDVGFFYIYIFPFFSLFFIFGVQIPVLQKQASSINNFVPVFANSASKKLCLLRLFFSGADNQASLTIITARPKRTHVLCAGNYGVE